MLGKNSLWHVWRAELPTGPLLEKAAMEKLRTWASFLDPDPRHSARVTRIALQLYDALSQDGRGSKSPSIAAFWKPRRSCMMWDAARERTGI